MARTNDPDSTVEVRKIAERKGVTVGKPSRIITSSMKAAACGTGLGGGAGPTMGSGGNFYSPELSTDFLELPQSDDEKRNFYRFFYDHDPFVGQALDILDELPLSKVRLRKPKAKNEKLAAASLRFFEKWADRIGLLDRLMSINHEWNLIGEAHIFCEDTSPETPEEIEFEVIREITQDGEIVERKARRKDADERLAEWLRKNYRGWTAIRCLPPEQIHIESFPFTDEKLVELIPDSKTKAVINRAQQGDLNARRIVDSMPQDVVAAIGEGQNIPLNTDPEAGSFYYCMSRKKSDYEPRGKSILQRCFLPGTPIWVERSGVLLPVSVEDVQDTDKALTHKGRFRPLQRSSRPVAEDIVALNIEGIQDPLRVTTEHEVLVMQPDGAEKWVAAGQIQPGDLLVDGFVDGDADPRAKIDLVQWWSGRDLVGTKRGRGGAAATERRLHVQDVKASSGLDVTFSYENDNRNRNRALPAMTRLLEWARGLVEPVLLTQAEVASAAGVSPRDVRVYAPRLRKEGLLHTEAIRLGRGRGTTTRWFRSSQEIPTVSTVLHSEITEVPLTEDFCFLLGTWLGDGCIWSSPDNVLGVHSVGWSLHDPKLSDRVLTTIAKVFPGARVGHSPKDPHGPDRVIQDSLLARWFQEEFGKTAQGKRLPLWVFSLPGGHIKALLQGLLDTDGYVKGGRYPRIEISLDNALLLEQVKLLASRIGIRCHIRQVKTTARSWLRTWSTKNGERSKTYRYPGKTYAKLECSRWEDVREWAQGSMKGAMLDFSQQKQTHGVSRVGPRLVRPVLSVNHQPYQGLVYSFGVTEDESHVTGGVVTHNCLRWLVFRDKVRQSLTSIASRHMTPYRLIYAEDMNDVQVEDLREQVDIALQDPDFSIITNFQVTWEEMGADQRLPDWSWVFDFTDRQMYAGLGMTESILSGESSYSGDRINLEVINQRFMLNRERLQELVEKQFFRPMALRMGFVEEDDDGNLDVIIPRLSFTRLSFRDNSETFDALMNLYQKGSLDIDTILEHLNLDPITIREKLMQDFGTVQDSAFNEVLRALYTRVGDALAENSDFAEKIARYLDLKYEKPKEEGGRF